MRRTGERGEARWSGCFPSRRHQFGRGLVGDGRIPNCSGGLHREFSSLLLSWQRVQKNKSIEAHSAYRPEMVRVPLLTAWSQSVCSQNNTFIALHFLLRRSECFVSVGGQESPPYICYYILLRCGGSVNNAPQKLSGFVEHQVLDFHAETGTSLETKLEDRSTR